MEANELGKLTLLSYKEPDINILGDETRLICCCYYYIVHNAYNFVSFFLYYLLAHCICFLFIRANGFF